MKTEYLYYSNCSLAKTALKATTETEPQLILSIFHVEFNGGVTHSLVSPLTLIIPNSKCSLSDYPTVKILDNVSLGLFRYIRLVFLAELAL